MARDCRNRGGVDYRTTATVAQKRQRMLAAQKGALHVDRQMPPHLRQRRLFDRSRDDDSGIVDQDVQLSEPVANHGNGAGPVFVVGDIQVNEAGLVAQRGGRGVAICLCQVGDDHAGALCGEQPRFGQPDPHGPACNQRHFA